MRRWKLKYKDDRGKTYYAFWRQPREDDDVSTGWLWVEDALDGTLIAVPEDRLEDITPDHGVWNPAAGAFEGGDEIEVFLRNAFTRVREEAKKLPKGLQKGKWFRLPHADGYAYYVVTAVFRKNCDIEWRHFSGDAWVDDVLGWGGRFPKTMIAPLVQREDAMEEL